MLRVFAGVPLLGGGDTEDRLKAELQQDAIIYFDFGTRFSVIIHTPDFGGDSNFVGRSPLSV
jgi:hypothetical protein